MKRAIFAGAIAALALGMTAPAFGVAERPAALQGVGIEQRLDQQLPLDLAFRDDRGETVKLGDFFTGKPVLLDFAYYRCPMLCPMALDALVRTMRPLSMSVGDEFDIVTVSIDSRETPAAAAEKKRLVTTDYGRKSANTGWHFLTGDAEAVRRLTEAAGYRFQYDGATDQFAHAAGVIVATPQGRISRYLYGIDIVPRDLRLALVEASQNRIGTLADQILLFCYHYDPSTGKYGPAAMTAVRIGGLLTLVVLGTFVGTQLRHERSQPGA